MRTRLPRRRFLSLAAAGFGLALAGLPDRRAVAGSQPSQPVSAVLPNGLTIIVQERTSADTVAVQHTALAGVRDDGSQPGVTVLTSRMLLAGSVDRPSDIAMQNVATLAGGTLARGTTSEASTIASVMPASSAELAFDLISDAIINPLFSPSSFQAQQALALQGIAQRQTDPSLLVNDLFQQTLFAGQPLGFAPLGTSETVGALTLDTIMATWQTLWGGANAVLTISGRLAATDALDLANQYFGPLFAGTANVRRPTKTQPPAAPQTVTGTAGAHPLFRIGFLAPEIGDPDRYPVAVLTGIMSGFAGRLLRALRTEQGISFAPSATYQPFSDAGEWFADVDVDTGKVEQALTITRTEIQRLIDELADPAEVGDSTDAISGEEILASESNADVASQLAMQQIFGDVSTAEFVQRVQAVTPDDVQRVARTYLQRDHALTVQIGPVPSS